MQLQLVLPKHSWHCCMLSLAAAAANVLFHLLLLLLLPLLLIGQLPSLCKSAGIPPLGRGKTAEGFMCPQPPFIRCPSLLSL